MGRLYLSGLQSPAGVQSLHYPSSQGLVYQLLRFLNLCRGVFHTVDPKTLLGQVGHSPYPISQHSKCQFVDRDLRHLHAIN